jgi:hypothetical protein
VAWSDPIFTEPCSAKIPVGLRRSLQATVSLPRFCFRLAHLPGSLLANRLAKLLAQVLPTFSEFL